MEKILAEEGLPTISFIWLIESGFNTSAILMQGQWGRGSLFPAPKTIWIETQLWYDERRDFEKSRGACGIRRIVAEFQSWELALAAYMAAKDA
jgi:hypothetical protein